MKSVIDWLSRVKNKRLLVVFPHPDDESVMAGGLIQRAVALGWQVKLICLTCGERGQNYGDQSRFLPDLRAEEYQKAMRALKVSDFELLTYCDGHLAKERSWERELRSKISGFDPGLVVSYDERGVTGHQDHIAVAKLLLKLKRCGAKWQLIAPVFDDFPEWMMMDKTRSVQGANFVLDLSLIEGLNKLTAVLAHDSQKLMRGWWNEKKFWWRVFRQELFAIV